MLRRPRRQPLLLDRYWNALRTDAATTPPDGLDPDLQAQTARLADSARQLDATSRFALRLRSHLQAQPATTSERAWQRPALDVRRVAASSSQLASETERETTMAEITKTPGGYPADIRQRHRLREWSGLAAAAFAIILVGVVLALIFRGDDSGDQLVAPGPTATPAVIPSPAATETLAPTATVAVIAPTATAVPSATSTPAPTSTATAVPRPDLPAAGTIVATIPVGAGPFEIAAGAGSIWVASADGTIARIDPATNAVVATIPFDDPPLRYPKVVFADGAIWATSYGKFRVVKIDPAANEVVDTIRTTSFVNDIAVANGVLWYSSFESGAVLRVDLATKTEVARVPVPVPASILLTEDAVWVASATDKSTITKIDPATNTVAATITLEQSTGPMFAADETSLWTGTAEHGWAGDGTVTRLDLTTNQVTAMVPLPGTPGAIALGDGAVWASFPDTLYRLDPTTNQLLGMLSVPDIWPITYAEGSIWAATANAVVRIDPAP